MGKERDTYYFDRRGQVTWNRSDASVIQVDSLEHDVYGNPTYSASILDLEGAQEALPLLRAQRHYREVSAISWALRSSEKDGWTLCYESVHPNDVLLGCRRV